MCGPTDTAIVLSDGRCFVSGLNKQGQLGLGHYNPVLTPTLIPDFSVRSISLGPNSSALVDFDGELYTFGFGGSTIAGLGQLGHGDAATVLTPKLVTSIVEDGCYVKQVEVGEYHTAVLTTEGEVLCAGAGSYGRLGNFENTDQVFFEPVELLTAGVEQIAAGKSFTLALKDGIVSGWGRNHKGQVSVSHMSAYRHRSNLLHYQHTYFMLTLVHDWNSSLELGMVWQLICTPWLRCLPKLYRMN